MGRIRVEALADINSLCETGLKIRKFNKNDVRIIKKERIKKGIEAIYPVK